MLKIAEYDPHGASLAVEIRCGHAQPGSYTIIFWEAETNAFFRPDARGNFINNDDDTYHLDGPLADHDGRIIDAIVTLRLVPPITDYRTELIVHQGDTVLASDVIEGQSDATTVSHEHFVLLKAVSA